MIRPLRQRHRWMTLVLGVGAIVVFIAGTLARRSPEVSGEVPAALRAPKPALRDAIASHESERGTIVTISPAAESDRNYYTVRLAPEISAPKLVVYSTTTTGVANGDTLPLDATLLGSFDAKGELVAPVIAPASAALVVYSLAWYQVVDVAPLAPANVTEEN